MSAAISGSNNGGKVHVKGLKGALAGSIAGFIEILLTYPTEYAKTQLQLQEGRMRKTGQIGKSVHKSGLTSPHPHQQQYTGFIDVLTKTVKTHGIKGVYSGLPIVLYGTVPKSAVRFGSYEEFKKIIQSRKNSGNSDPLPLTFPQSILCGLGSGVVSSILVITPVETIKVKFINDKTLAQPQFKGFFHGIREIIRKDGLIGCYQGLLPTVIKQGSNQAIRFALMETLKDLYLKHSAQAQKSKSKSVPKLVVGFFGVIAGGASVLANAPVDVVKTRMQGLGGGKYKNMLDCGLQIWREEGWRALYKGTVPRLIHSCSEVAILFVVFDCAMEFLNKVYD